MSGGILAIMARGQWRNFAVETGPSHLSYKYVIWSRSFGTARNIMAQVRCCSSTIPLKRLNCWIATSSRSSVQLWRPNRTISTSASLGFQNPIAERNSNIRGWRPKLISKYFSASVTDRVIESADSNFSSDRRRDLRRGSRLLVWSTVAASATIGLYLYDKYIQASVFLRTARLFRCALLCAIDFKLNFTEKKSDKIQQLHERVARRIFNVVSLNGGLYIKMGQAIAMQSAFLPKPYIDMFSKLFDEAPQVSWSQIEHSLTEQLGQPPDEIFEWIDHTAAASASIAQVHKAKLRNNMPLTNEGEPLESGLVAVKVEKPDVLKQVDWDLAAYRWVMYIYDRYLFDIPLYFTVDYITSRLRTETDFLVEAENSQTLQRHLDTDREARKLRPNIKIPRTVPELCTHQVMTAEWIDGVRLYDFDNYVKEGISKQEIMQLLIEFSSMQIFRFGNVHADPHPGNFLVRRNPDGNGHAQLVVLDHGLYVHESDKFRQEFAQLFTSIFQFDNEKIKEITREWGMAHSDLLASLVLLRPYQGFRSKNSPKPEDMDRFTRELLAKERLKTFLLNQDKVPKEIIFIGRCMRMMQANNQKFGSPVNRVSIMASVASRSLAKMQNLNFRDRVRSYLLHVRFLLTRTILDVSFVAFNVYHRILRCVGISSNGRGFEAQIHNEMKRMMEKQFGLEMNEDAFTG